MKTIGEFLFPEIAEKYGKTTRRAVCAAALVLSVLLFCTAVSEAFGTLFAAVRILSGGAAA